MHDNNKCIFQVEMHLDTGEGLRYNASLPTDQHRLLRIKSASVLGHVVYNEWRKELTVSKSLGKCWDLKLLRLHNILIL